MFGNKGHVLLRLDTEYIDMTGAAVNTTFVIPYPHRLCSVEVKHTDGDGDDNTTALTTGVLQVDKWDTTDWFDLWDYSGVAASDFLRICGDGWEAPERASYRFQTNTTDGHRVYYELVFQLLDKRGREVPAGN